MKWGVLMLMGLMIGFNAGAQTRYDVVIDEIMADPSPTVGLPNVEWIEIKNVSPTAINLQNWRIGDASGQSSSFPSLTLQPDSFAIICGTSAATSLSVFGNVIAVTAFPSLDNDGDLIYLKSANGSTIHAVGYTTSWYNNELKKGGGWTLEMIDTKNLCSGISNWRSSISNSGGTPGKKNSVNAINKDESQPRVKNGFTTDSITIVVEFDEPVDSLKASILSNYAIDKGNIVSVTVLPPLFNRVQIKTGAPMLPGIVYLVTVNNISDCSNNLIGANNKTRVGLTSDPSYGELIINEILFNPVPGAFDYVEFYNNSDKIFDASRLSIGNRNSSGSISSVKLLSANPFYIFPGDYLVVTENAIELNLHYFVKDPGQVIELTGMPSFPDDEGDVISLNFQGEITDEVRYNHDWHFKLINNEEGVSLERIDQSATTQDENNWHSAASTVGYGTPGYRNSQYRDAILLNSTIAVLPKVFSPDNDGHDDVATVQYSVNEPGYIANVIILDVIGRPIRYLVRNAILGRNGYWIWDGLNDKGMKLAVGVYIIFTELFNLHGKKMQFKNIIILGAKIK